MQIEVIKPERTERLGNKLWVLTDWFIFSIDGKRYEVPPGFVINGASSPQLLYSVCAPMAGPFGQASIPHDWFYDVEGPDVSRFYADYVLYKWGRMHGASLIRAQAVKTVLNLCGWAAYKTGKDKITKKSAYHYAQARLRVAQLKSEGASNGNRYSYRPI